MEAREWLNGIYAATSREKFVIVVYILSEDMEALQRVREVFPNDFILVSDFLGRHSPVGIHYGAQVTPTIFLIDRKGIVERRDIQNLQEIKEYLNI